MTRARALAASLLAALVACSSGQESEDSIDAPTPTGAGASSTGTTAAADPTTTTDDSTGDTSTTTAAPVPPPECGDLAVCGVQCVDLQTDPSNCGQCGITCVIPNSAPGCAAGQCALGQCDDGWFDCDQDLLNGCEAQLAPGQMCGLVCKDGKPEACNLFDDDCSGQCDDGALPGCRQAVHRAVSPTLGHFYTIDPNEAMSGDITPEFLNYYYLYTAAAGPDLRAPRLRSIRWPAR